MILISRILSLGGTRKSNAEYVGRLPKLFCIMFVPFSAQFFSHGNAIISHGKEIDVYFERKVSASLEINAVRACPTLFSYQYRYNTARRDGFLSYEIKKIDDIISRKEIIENGKKEPFPYIFTNHTVRAYLNMFSYQHCSTRVCRDGFLINVKNLKKVIFRMEIAENDIENIFLNFLIVRAVRAYPSSLSYLSYKCSGVCRDGFSQDSKKITAYTEKNISGVENSETGNKSSVPRNESFVAGDKSSVAGNEGSVASDKSSVAGNEGSVAGNESSVAGNEVSVAGNESSVAGNESSVAGNEDSVAGNENYMKHNSYINNQNITFKFNIK
jgi:hypothetical protein